LEALLKLRYEHKYLIDYGTYLKIKDRLSKVLKLDDNSVGGKGYHIRSLYFDDIYESALMDKSAGILNRKKYRIRIYNYSEEVIKLEIKRKFQDYTNKISTRITKDDYKKIYTGDVADFPARQNEVMTNYYLQVRNNILKPKVIVDYYREAYILPYNQIRITFDNKLSAAAPQYNIFTDDVYSKRLDEKYSRIIEVKYNNFLPDFVKKVFEPFPMTRLSVSKYVLCREELIK
jgi:hypothetical protein